ncbi:MAG: glycoside hydrolase family 26 protein [Prevotella sp.]|nr:glycoside hydrolase family 26 protein [Prevotella sp.]
MSKTSTNLFSRLVRFNTFAAIIGLISLTACSGGDDSDDPTPTPTPTVTVNLASQSIAEGAEVDANSTTVLTLTYSTSVKVSSSANVTLNGTKLTASRKTTDVTAVEIPLSLEEGVDYTLIVAKGSIVANSDATASAPEFKLNFKTKEKAQPVNPDIAQTPVVASTEPALKLYSYMVEQYGQKTISSVMANVNWNNELAEKVYSLTKKYPAAVCYDFIHICYSPANWIDYTDITPVKKWSDAGGIVELMWHFNVPKEQGSSDVTCTPSETTFKASNVFTEGSWENKWFYEQMDKVVATLLKLQDAGIAATWRPFHEAAGNSTARQQASWTKSWFWWGYDGADVYKKLWTTMFNYFKEKGVKNLIWVWTTQNYNGNSTTYNQDTAWYPGDAYVDIVARDLYGYTAAQNLQEFTEIQSAYPNKMIALGECGYGTVDGQRAEQGNISDCWNLGAHWSHFMVWYEGGQGSTNTMVTDGWWKDAMQCDNVITRDQLPSLK